MRRLELLLALLLLAGLALAIALERRAPPEQTLFGAEPALAPVLAPLVFPQGTLTLEGRVTAAAGGAAEGAFVVLLPADESSELPPLHRAYTDPDGRFVLHDLPAGSLRVVLSHPAAPPRTFALELPAPGPVEWVLAEPLPELPTLPPLVRTRLTGHVRAEEGSATGADELGGFEIWLVPEDATPLLAGAAERRATTDAQGRFAFDALVVAPYRAHCLPPWARGGTWPVLAGALVTPSAEGESSLVLALEVGAVEGTVAEAGGRPLSGAVVSVAALEALDPVGQPALWPPVVTDPGGRFRVELLPPGRYLVHARAGAAREDAEVEVTAGRVAPVPLGPLAARRDEAAPRQ